MSDSEGSTQTFESLDVWKKGRSFRSRISELVEDFPDREEYNLSDQLLRSSRSFTANIAEGYGRFHYQENIQFCRQSRGSLFEILDHLTVAQDEGYIDEQRFESLRQDVNELLRLINGYISYIEREKEESYD